MVWDLQKQSGCGVGLKETEWMWCGTYRNRVDVVWDLRNRVDVVWDLQKQSGCGVGLTETEWMWCGT